MNTRKKVLVLFGVFLAAAAVYFMLPAGKKEENNENVTYTAMAEATLPVVYPNMLGRDMAPLFGHREEKAVTAARDSLIVLSADRKLPIRIEHAKNAASIHYEIRTLDMENLIERTEIMEWEKNSEELDIILPIQNLIEAETEYQLAVCVGLKDGTEAWYYSRILETKNENVEAMLALAEEYSEKTFHYHSAQELTTYMETSPTADNSSYGVVTLKNSFSLMTWGALGVEQISEPRLTLKELDGNLANISLEYEVERNEEGTEREYYTVTENFTMKWTSQRIYMMDYERKMNQVFTGARNLYSGKRITIGISDEEDLYVEKSADGRFAAFVNKGELWSFDSAEGKNIRVFAFGGSDKESLKDLRANNSRHGVEILHVGEDGDLDFLVYGYMNRGEHEGWTGVAYYHYEADSNTLEERFFVPAAESYAELKADIEKLSVKGKNEIFYVYMCGSIYGIDLTSHEYVTIAHGLDSERFAVSGDRSRFAWQENTGLYDSETLYVMDVNTGVKSQIGSGNGEVYRILGFVGSDLVYGVGDAGDYMMSNGRVMGLYMKTIEITDADMESVMHYEKSGQYIRDARVDESRIHITLVKDRTDGFFGGYSEDTLVCNAETIPDRMDDIGWYASDEKGRVYFIQLTKDISSGQKITSSSPKKLVTEKDSVIMPEKAAEDTMTFYAYGRGRLLGIYTDFADAAEAAYDCMGFVCAGKNEPVWVRGNKSSAYFARDVQKIVKSMEEYRKEFSGVSMWKEDVLLLETSGAELNQILYFVGQNFPAAVNLGEGDYRCITGYDQTHVRLWNPYTNQPETMSFDAAKSLFEQHGNDYICCVSR